MKYFILTLFVLNAFSFSLNDDWDGMEEVIKVQQDAILDLVDQLDVYSETPITQQIENQVQQLMNPPLETDHTKQSDEQSEVHSLEYWLERLGDEYSDETILLQQSQTITEQVTTVLDDLILKVEDDQQIDQQTETDSTLIIDSIRQFQQDQNNDENIKQSQTTQLQSQDDQQQLIDLNQIQDQFNEIDSTISEVNVQQQLNESSEDTLQVQIDSTDEDASNESANEFSPIENAHNIIQDSNTVFTFMNHVQEDSYIQSQQKVKDTYNFKEYSFNKDTGDQRSIYKENDDSTVEVVEREEEKESSNNPHEEVEFNKAKQSTLNSQPEEISGLKKYLLYTDQPEVISTGTTEKEIEEDRRLITAFKSMNRDEYWEKTNKKQKINSDVRDELLKLSNVSEDSKQKEPQFQEITENKVENPHKFISFKADPKVEYPENTQKGETVKSKYDELPETKLQSKEEMKRDKEQKILEMQKIIEEQLKNKKLIKQSETDKSFQYESEYLEWERTTQSKVYPEINFVMTQNNLRKRL
ncbi:unnamed protein product [Paramecium octaurelia]|uniref:Uncharacterized protein n=1 Tax=Paramecium octaurelia TaxID=43137 RepID=A0A8S1XJR6_PAROT|nr:unnamed protein product [Paramecium octaurelia]